MTLPLIHPLTHPLLTNAHHHLVCLTILLYHTCRPEQHYVYVFEGAQMLLDAGIQL
jgi:hypothetical protein